MATLWVDFAGEPFSGVSMQDMFFNVFSLVLILCFLEVMVKVGRPVTLTWRKERMLRRKIVKDAEEREQFLSDLHARQVWKEEKGKPGMKGDVEIVDMADDNEKAISVPLLIDSNGHPETKRTATVTVFCTSRTELRKAEERLKKIAINRAPGDEQCVNKFEGVVLQTEVELNGGVVEELGNTLLTETFVEKSWTVQIEGWALRCDKGDEKKVELVKLPIAQLPMIFNAEYAAGLLTITGVNLKGARIYAVDTTTPQIYRLDVLRFLPRGSPKWRCVDEEVLTLPLHLHSQGVTCNMMVFAAIDADGVDEKPVCVRSKAVYIHDVLWVTVFRLWIPTAILVIHLVYNFLAPAVRIILHWWPVAAPLSVLFPIWGTQILIQTVVALRFFPKCFADFLQHRFETVTAWIGRTVLVLYYGFLNLKGPQISGRLLFGEPRTAFLGPQPAFKVPPVTVQPPLPGLKRSPPPPLPGLKRPPPPPPSENPVESPDWQWPVYDKYGRTKNGADESIEMQDGSISGGPFKVFNESRIGDSKKSGPAWADAAQVYLSSTHLIETVRQCLPWHTDLQYSENPRVHGKYLFTVLDVLKKRQELFRTNRLEQAKDRENYVDQARSGDEPDLGAAELHLNHLVRFVEKEYSNAFGRFLQMKEQKHVAWDMLWAFLTPGRKVVYKCDHSQEMLAGLVSKSEHEGHYSSRGLKLVIELDVWDYDGSSYHKCQINRSINHFDGERAFTSLAVRPMEMEGDPAALDARLQANGRLFQALALKDKHRFMQYSGLMYQKTADKTIKKASEVSQPSSKEKADGRVMIDLTTFAMMNPDYPMQNARPPWELDIETRIEQDEISDENLIFAPAVVYGFSFTLNKWGCFALNGFTDISFDFDSFEELVMAPEKKDLVYNLVSQYAVSDGLETSKAGFQGKGCVFLCYGPPGTGKTLTAESVAEKVRRPLWSLKTSDLCPPLGSKLDKLEKKLVKTLDIAAKWKAVLLVDEADMYLERYSSYSDLEANRNAMIGVFLHVLESYRGVLFLTTKRIQAFDDTFRSRISVFLRYDSLSIEQREQIWKTLLGRAGIQGVTKEIICRLGVQNLNGLEIRNAIRTAQNLAKSKGETSELSHVLYLTSEGKGLIGNPNSF